MTPYGNQIRFGGIQAGLRLPFLKVMLPLFRQALAVLVLPAAVNAVAAEPVPADAAPGASEAAIVEPVRKFLEAFIDPDQSPEQQARFFAEGAEYYRFGPASRKEIAVDIKRYVKRWPIRSYRLLDIEYLKSDPHTDDVFVSYVIAFDVANATSRLRGQANYGAFITDVHTTPRIGMIMERIVDRE